jgi:hypothetical protein
LKPLLVDRVAGLVKTIEQKGLTALLSKQVQPLAYKLLDDNRGDVKAKTEKLLKKLYEVQGSALIDNCPAGAKKQKVFDIVSGGKGGLTTAHFGADDF